MAYLCKVAVHRLGVEPRDVDAVEAGLHPEARLGQHLVVEHVIGEGGHMHAPDLLRGDIWGGDLVNELTQG